MLGTLSVVKNQLKVGRKTNTEHFVFRLHRYTSVIFLSACVLVTASSLVGRPIMCYHNRMGPDHMAFMKTLNSYCWISSTFSVYKNNSPIAKVSSAIHLLLAPRYFQK